MVERSRLIVLLMGAVLMTTSGCNRSRLFARRDYNEMHDPFMESGPNLADSEKSATTEAPGVGVAKVGQSPASTATALSSTRDPAAAAGTLSGPKPIGASATRPGTNVAQAAYPDGALGRAGTTTAVYPQGDQLQKIGPAGMTSGLTAAPADARTASSGPSLSDFMNVTPSPDPAAKSPAAAPRTVQDDFASWASQQTRSTGTAAAPAAAAINGAPAGPLPGTSVGIQTAENPFLPGADLHSPGTAQSAPPAAPASSNPFADLATEAPAFDDDVTEQAEPLIRQPPAAAMAGAAARPAVSPTITAGANPFAGFEHPGQRRPSAPDAQTSAGVGRAAFEMDSGWKPSQFVRP